MIAPVAILFLISSTLALSPRIFTSDFIDEINSKQSSWVAGRNFPNDMPLASLHLMGSGYKGLHPDPKFKPRIVHHEVRDGLPKSFDARDAWPNCQSIGHIRNQGECGSCWAFGTVTVMSDRLCIESNATEQFMFSPEEPLSCCSECGSCSGGYPGLSYDYWTEEGIVSGGDAGSDEGCQPYAKEAFEKGETPKCVKTCDKNYRTAYEQDKHYGDDLFYQLNGVNSMGREIIMRGPITVTIEVFEDFYNYKSGVYQHVTGTFIGYHVVKVLGWGEQHGFKYWLVANSWGTEFGENGFFKILRGQNECGIEDEPIAAMAKV